MNDSVKNPKPLTANERAAIQKLMRERRALWREWPKRFFPSASMTYTTAGYIFMYRKLNIRVAAVPGTRLPDKHVQHDSTTLGTFVNLRGEVLA